MSGTTNYPGAGDDTTSLPNPTANDTTKDVPHAELHTAQNKAIIAVEGKLGTGASTPAANKVLMGDGDGSSSWTDAVPQSSISNLTSDLAAKADTVDLPTTFDDLTDGTTNKAYTATEKTKLAGIAAGAEVNAVDSVNAKTGAVVLSPDDLDDTTTTNKFVTAADLTKLGNTSGVNTGDQIISDATITLSDVTTNNASATKHGFVPKLPADSTKFLNGVGVWATPAGGGGSGSVSTDTIWDEKGDLAVGTGIDTAAKLAPGTDGQVLTADSAQATGLKWDTPATGDMLAATYDPNAVAADAFSQDNMADGATNKNYTATEQTKLAGIEALADVTGAGNVGSAIHGATAKTALDDADEVPLIDSAALNVLKKITWANVKTALASLFVGKTGDETIDGIKTFSSSPGVPTPSGATDAANKSYVDSNLGSSSFVSNEAPTSTPDGFTAVFTSVAAYVASTLDVFINGVLQARGTDYTETTPSSGTFTLATPPLSSDVMRLNYQKSVTTAGNADTVDGFNASSTPTANELVALDANGHLPSAALGNDTSWTIPTFQNSWVNYGAGGFGVVAFRKDANGYVHIKGLAKSGTIGSVPMFTLPAGYRPGATITQPVRSNNAFGYVEILTTGEVEPKSGSSVHFGLDGIIFLAEA